MARFNRPNIPRANSSYKNGAGVCKTPLINISPMLQGMRPPVYHTSGIKKQIVELDDSASYNRFASITSDKY